MNWLDKLQAYWQKHHHTLINDEDSQVIGLREKRALERKKQQLKDRKGEVVHAISDAEIVGCHYIDQKEHVHYGVHHSYFIKQKAFYYIEEWMEERKAVFAGEQLVEEKALADESFFSSIQKKYAPINEYDRRFQRFQYNRLQTVKYAEKWWNSYNPKFRRFDVDCTNYVSQCLHAGGAPMRGYPNRSTGWWFQNNNWSYSWSVAHALRWYLSGSETGLMAEEVSHPQQLEPGDVICYDFDGDGKWQHNTIVVAKDEQQMPLVNAHTTNSRMRYWAYEDSTAWTNKIQYKFFHITDG